MKRFNETQQKPRFVGKRELPKFDAMEALAVGLLMLLAFLAGAVFIIRLTDGQVY